MGAALGASAMGGAAKQPAFGEALRISALEAIFTGMHVSVDRSRKIDDSWPAKPKPGDIVFPDALANATVYRAIGEARNEAERCAAEDAFSRKSSSTRLVRFRLFRWPNESEAGLLAVLQYSFLDVTPAMACPSIGLLVHLSRKGESWELGDQYLLEIVHHESLQRIDLVDLGGGAEELVIESNYGSAGMVASGLQVFDLRRGRFEELISVDSRAQFYGETSSSQMLDIDRTRQSHGQEFCFTKATTTEQGAAPQTNRDATPCYEIGEGVEFKAAGERNKMLAPEW